MHPMSMQRDITRRLRQIAPQIFWGCLVSYFAFHAVQGDRGVVAWLQMRQQLAALDHQLETNFEAHRVDGILRCWSLCVVCGVGCGVICGAV